MPIPLRRSIETDPQATVRRTETARRYALTAAACGAICAVMGALNGLGQMVGQHWLPVYPPGASTMAPWVAGATIALGCAIFATSLRRHTVAVRLAQFVPAAVVMTLALADLALRAAAAPRSNAVVAALTAARPIGAVGVAAFTAALLCTATGRLRWLSNIIALLIGALCLAFPLGLLYGAPVFANFGVQPVSISSSCTALIAALGIMTANGPDVWPTRLISGPSVPALMLRWLLPLVALAVVVTDVATIALFANHPPALRSALNTIVSLAVTVLVVTYVGRSVGARLDRSYAALRESEHKFSIVFSSAPAGLAVSDAATGELLDVNDEFTEIFGYSHREAVGRTSVELGIWPDTAYRTRHLAMVEAAGGVTRDVDLALRARDGRPLTLRSASTLTVIANRRILISAFLDITAARQAEAALHASTQKFATIFRKSPVGLAVSEYDTGRFVDVNAALLHMMHGTTFDQMVGKTSTEIGMVTAKDRHDHIITAMRHGLGQRLPVPMRRLDGEPFEAELSLGEFEEDGVRYLLTNIVDVTARVRLAEELRQAQKMEAIGRLAGGIAHDFSNLLTVVIGSGQLALDTLEPDRPERADVAEMLNAARRAAELTRQLLAFSRRQVLAPRNLRVDEVLGGMRRLLERMVGDDVSVRIEVAPELGTVRADPTQLEQVIANLAVNARDAMPAGGTLTLRAENVAIDEAFARTHLGAHAGAYVRLAVTDTGTGMSNAVKERIFEPFFTTKELGKGTGLGLATVFGIVQQSGGFIVVDTAMGRGTTFEIHLPRVERAAAPESGDGEPVVADPGGSETVLVVDDTTPVRDLVTCLLQDRGYTVLTAANGGEALAASRHHAGEISLLVADVVMPEMSGPALAEQLTRLRPALKVLYISGSTDEMMTRSGFAGPGEQLLRKPFAPDTLAQRVREALDR